MGDQQAIAGPPRSKGRAWVVGELPEFIVWIVHREAILQTVGRNGAGAFRHSLDRRQCTACKRVPPKPGSCDAEWQTDKSFDYSGRATKAEPRFQKG